MSDQILERISKPDGSISVAALMEELINSRARIKQLTDAIDQLFTLVQDKGQPLTHPTNQALINAGDTISVSEGNLWNLKWVLMAHSPPHTSGDCDAK